MFDFFDETIEFLSQITYWINWGVGTCKNILTAGTGSLVQWSEFFVSLPEPASWLCISTLAVLIFSFIRGR